MAIATMNSVDRTRVLASLASLEDASEALDHDQDTHTIQLVQDTLLHATVQLRLALGLRLELERELSELPTADG